MKTKQTTKTRNNMVDSQNHYGEKIRQAQITNCMVPFT